MAKRRSLALRVFLNGTPGVAVVLIFYVGMLSSSPGTLDAATPEFWVACSLMVVVAYLGAFLDITVAECKWLGIGRAMHHALFLCPVVLVYCWVAVRHGMPFGVFAILAGGSLFFLGAIGVLEWVVDRKSERARREVFGSDELVGAAVGFLLQSYPVEDAESPGADGLRG